MNWLHRFFVPSEENGYRPNSLEARASAIMLLLIMCTFAIANVHAILLVSSDWFVGSIIPAALITMTNEQRDTEALPTLARSTILDTAAQMKADDMARYSYFAHESPDGITPWHWFEKAGYTYAYAGENLAVHFSDSEEVVKAWMNSPGHRANIMASNYREIGIGTAKGTYKGTPTVYVVQFFGTPQSALTPSATAPRAKASVTKKNSVAISTAPNTTPVVLGVEDEKIRATIPDDIKTHSKKTISESMRIVTSATPIEAVYERLALATDDTNLLAQVVPTLSSSKKTHALELGLATTVAPVGASVGGVSYTMSSPSISVRIGELLYRLLASPRIIMSVMYLLLTCTVVFMLAAAIVIEVRHQHPLQVAYGVGLMAVMFLMFTIHLSLTSGALII